MVMHGVVPYSSPAVNASADPETLLLMSAATGSCLSFNMLSAETSLLKDTEFDIYYYADQANWKDTAAAEYSLLEPLLSDISTSTITDYENDKAGNRITVAYSNGTVVRVDFKDKNIWYNDKLISLGKEAEEGGIRY
jgi:DNA-binding XRE family transcriptional regulator